MTSQGEAELQPRVSIASTPPQPSAPPAAPFRASTILVLARTDDRLAITYTVGLDRLRPYRWRLLWSGTGLMILGVLATKGRFTAAEIVLMLGIALGFIQALAEYVMIRARLTTLIFEGGRCVFHTKLFQSSRGFEIALDANSKAELTASRDEKRVAASFAIDLYGSDSDLRIGTELNDRDAEWLVQAINAFLRTSQGMEVAAGRGRYAQLGLERAVEGLDPEALSAESEIRITRPSDSSMELRFRTAAMKRWGCVSGISLCAMGIGYAVHFNWPDLVMLFQNGRGVDPLVMILMALPGLVMFGLGIWILAAWLRVTTIDVTPEQLRYRTRVGPFGLTELRRRRYIDRIAVRAEPQQLLRFPEGSWARDRERGLVCVLHGDGRPLQLTLGQTDQTAEEVAGLLNWHLERTNATSRIERRHG